MATVEIIFRDHHDCLTLTGLVSATAGCEAVFGQPRLYRKRSFIWDLSPSEHAVYFLKRGEVRIMLVDTNGCEVTLRVVKPGESFGELCFCAKKNMPRENCALAVTQSEVQIVRYSDFLDCLRQRPTILEKFAFTLCERLSQAERRIEILSYRGAEARLGRLLLELARSRSERETGDGWVKVLHGHDELGRMAAMTRPHVSTTMGKFRSEGLVRYARGSQLTINVEKLLEHILRSSTSG